MEQRGAKGANWIKAAMHCLACPAPAGSGGSASSGGQRCEYGPCSEVKRVLAHLLGTPHHAPPCDGGQACAPLRTLLSHWCSCTVGGWWVRGFCGTI